MLVHISECLDSMFCLQSRRQEALPPTHASELPIWDKTIHHFNFVYGFLLTDHQPHHSCGLSTLIQFYIFHNIRSFLYQANHKIPLYILHPQRLALSNSQTLGSFTLRNNTATSAGYRVNTPVPHTLGQGQIISFCGLLCPPLQKGVVQ